MAHSRSRSDSIFILLALGAALSSIAVAAPLHPASVLTRREDRRDLDDNDLLSFPFDNRAIGAGCSTPDLSQTLPENLSSREDNEPDDNVHHLIFRSSSSHGPLPLPTPVGTARSAMVLEVRRDPKEAQAALISREVYRSMIALGPPRGWTAASVHYRLSKLISWTPDLIAADGDMNRFYKTTSGIIYEQLLSVIMTTTDDHFNDKALWVRVHRSMMQVSPSMARAKKIWDSELMQSPGALVDLTSSAGPDLRLFRDTKLGRAYLAKMQELRNSKQLRLAAALEQVMGDALQKQTWKVAHNSRPSRSNARNRLSSLSKEATIRS
ncbi:hypothetical protein FB446DRAFT_48272 [Lentinula raphanica]|nr:hypothetical protein FB446DRAFT_48272 [Lentinula raphanica]